MASETVPENTKAGILRVIEEQRTSSYRTKRSRPFVLWDNSCEVPIEWLEYAINQGMTLFPDSTSEAFDNMDCFSETYVKTLISVGATRVLEHVDESENTLRALLPFWITMGAYQDIKALFALAGSKKIVSTMAVATALSTGEYGKADAVFHRGVDELGKESFIKMVESHIDIDMDYYGQNMSCTLEGEVPEGYLVTLKGMFRIVCDSIFDTLEL